MNFSKRGDVGAAVAIALDGRMVVDLWGGWADAARTRPWRQDTLVDFFSVGKAFSALCGLRLVERGLLDLDVPLARWWPELAGSGREAITLRHVLSHQGGLPGIAEPLPDGTMLDWTRMVHAPRAPAAVVDARHRARLPRQHLRLAGRRGGATRGRHHAGDAAADRDRWAAGRRRAHRPAA